MHANNEIGNLLPLVEVGTICKKYATLFFCDMVQSIGKYDLSLSGLPIDFAVASAHKFYGPKAVGLFYFTRKIPPFFYGGAQERTMRAGTENIYGICGMEKALQTSLHRLREMQTQVLSIKSYCVKRLVDTFDSISFIGDCKDGGLYNLLNFYFSDTNMETLRMRLDMAGIAVSSASACSSGTEEQSHVVAALNLQTKSLRVSFGIQTTSQDIDYLIETLTEILKNNP
jgi:cysteine desulfurase